MKVGHNEYLCPYCMTTTIQTVQRVSGAGKKGVAVSNVVCKCGRLVSQKTKQELMSKYGN